jgi:hypothetical protein
MGFVAKGENGTLVLFVNANTKVAGGVALLHSGLLRRICGSRSDCGGLLFL